MPPRRGTDQGPAIFYLSKLLTLTLLVVRTDVAVQGAFYEYFRFRRGGTHASGAYYSCQTCNAPVRVITVRDGRIVGHKSPCVDHSPTCRPLSEVDFEILMMKREMAVEAQKGNATPLAVHTN